MVWVVLVLFPTACLAGCRFDCHQVDVSRHKQIAEFPKPKAKAKAKGKGKGRKAGRGKGKGRGRGKAETKKRKAKTSCKPAATPKAKAKGKAKVKPSKGAEEVPGSKVEVPKDKVKATFARRNCPKSEPAKSWHVAVRGVFESELQPLLKCPSKHEDCPHCTCLWCWYGWLKPITKF